MDDLKHSGMAACLRHVRTHVDAASKAPGTGICITAWYYAQVTGTVDPAATDEWLGRAFTRLKLHPEYPVPDPDYADAGRAYDEADDLWDVGTAYGRNRRRLLDALIAIAEGRSYELRFE